MSSSLHGVEEVADISKNLSRKKKKCTKSPEAKGGSDLRPSMPEAMGCMLFFTFDFSGVQNPLTQEAQSLI